MKKQTAVEWLIEQLDEQVYRIDYKDNRINISISFQDMITIRKQAKAMEKEQIKDAYQKGDWDESYLEENKIWAEQYYNETYKDETT